MQIEKNALRINARSPTKAIDAQRWRDKRPINRSVLLKKRDPNFGVSHANPKIIAIGTEPMRNCETLFLVVLTLKYVYPTPSTWFLRFRTPAYTLTHKLHSHHGKNGD